MKNPNRANLNNGFQLSVTDLIVFCKSGLLLIISINKIAYQMTLSSKEENAAFMHIAR